MSSKATVRRHILERQACPKEKDRTSQNILSKHLKKIYPIGLQRTTSSLSLSSMSLSLSQNSNDSSLTDSSIQLDQKISYAIRLITPPPERREVPLPKSIQQQSQELSDGELRRCNWITHTSDKAYVSFHDECWGVPVYDDNRLFELLALSGMLMDYNWTEIVKRRELFREAFAGFEPSVVANMGEKEITDVASDKAIMLVESRVRCIVDNAKCILKIARDFGSFSNYMWSYVNFKPTINRFRHPRNVPLRSPKAEAISKDMVKRGFRFVGPVIVYSFMQAAGLTIDHLIDCFRHGECVNLAERPWRHI
ncbi:uncharacterized protein LOC101218195 [Cucumis sativus]|uniref:Uncharacterized protein n=1 Tax=Cucumis sativus TaxID=3659 RepID=A0A0A0KUC5_CUCSA|nr:uncharacterized protein LOC101218195 [Cucumis sativus]KGN52002.1 hypothetical protein Csa_009065 [Cucumis sativus]